MRVFTVCSNTQHT
uniref:Uncharacterized protein n=1 Tax=Anguilla anguilla TaxID=7936 RepID=A0A0E9RCK4_ANGAN